VYTNECKEKLSVAIVPLAITVHSLISFLFLVLMECIATVELCQYVLAVRLVHTPTLLVPLVVFLVLQDIAVWTWHKLLNHVLQGRTKGLPVCRCLRSDMF